MSVDESKKNLTPDQLNDELAKAESDYLDKVYRENLSETARNSLKASVLKALADIEVDQQLLLIAKEIPKYDPNLPVGRDNQIAYISNRILEKQPNVSMTEARQRAEKIAFRIGKQRIFASDLKKGVENSIKELAFNQQSTKDGLAEIQQNENTKREAIKLLREIKAPNAFVSAPHTQ